MMNSAALHLLKVGEEERESRQKDWVKKEMECIKRRGEAEYKVTECENKGTG